MESIYARTWDTNTRREKGEKILCEVSFIDNFVEKKATILATNNDFTIHHADVETLRGLSTKENNTIQVINKLVGMSVYSDQIGKNVRKVFKEDQTGYQTTLLMEAVRGILLSRSFFWQEAGFADEQAYENYWSSKLINTCVYQSNQLIVADQFLERRKKLGFHKRLRYLFNRQQHLSIFRCNSGLICNSSLLDTFHQVNLLIELNESLRIVSASGQIVRSPHNICSKATEALDKLVGSSMQPQDDIKPVFRLVAGSDGCFHMGTLVLAIHASLGLFKYLK